MQPAVIDFADILSSLANTRSATMPDCQSISRSYDHVLVDDYHDVIPAG